MDKSQLKRAIPPAPTQPSALVLATSVPPANHRLLQLGVFRLGLLQDGDVGVGVFPQGEEILVGGAGFDGVALHEVGATQLQMGERAQRAKSHDAPVVKELLELADRRGPLPQTLVRLSAEPSWI